MHASHEPEPSLCELPGHAPSAGRSVRVTVDVSLISPLLQLAIEIGFDWVIYANENYVRMSVIPNCKSIT